MRGYYLQLKEYYDKLSKVYDSLYKDEQIKKIVKVLKFINGEKILDVGAGTGILGEFLDKKMYLLDISDGMLEMAKKKLGMHHKYIVANASSIPFSDNFFDTVVSISMLQDVPPVDVPKVVGELVRVLKRGGKLVVTFLAKDEYINVFLHEISKLPIRTLKMFEDGKEFYFVGEKV